MCCMSVIEFPDDGGGFAELFVLWCILLSRIIKHFHPDRDRARDVLGGWRFTLPS